MDYQRLCEKKEQLKKIRKEISKEALQSFDKSFEIEYTHNSTAIEGNTLSLVQTKAVLEDGISVGGKTLREIYEVVNHDKAFGYIKKCISEGKVLDENIVKDIHSLLMENILTGGIYRNVDVRITGANHKPPTPNEMFEQIKNFYTDIEYRDKRNAIEFAAWTHAEFVRIHPFVDGNGRTSRMIMNYQLMNAGFLPVSIAKENRLEYFEALEVYAVEGDLKPFAEMIASMEEQRLDEYLSIV
ncbi:MAG: Fic family protein [Eubacterium sp.]|nr:Fic family protein [Eubacterium sp.]